MAPGMVDTCPQPPCTAGPGTTSGRGLLPLRSEDGRQGNPECRGALALSLPELESSVALDVLGPLPSASLGWAHCGPPSFPSP